jgi:hypothetical protein
MQPLARPISLALSSEYGTFIDKQRLYIYTKITTLRIDMP